MAAKKELRARLPVAYEKAVEMTRTALAAEGFGILTEIRVNQVLKEKIGADFGRRMPARPPGVGRGAIQHCRSATAASLRS